MHELRSDALVSILEEFDTRAFPVHPVYVRQGRPQKVRAFLDWMTPRLRGAPEGLSTFDPLGDEGPQSRSDQACALDRTAA